MFLAQRRALLLAVGGAAFAWFAPLARGAEARLPKAEWEAIKRVISQQLVAFKAGDGDKAFGFATAGIQAQFGDAAHFMAMVLGAYTDLLKARYTEFLEGAIVDGVVVQPLRLIAPDNTVRVALYSMEKQKRGWRISGCMIAPSTVQAA